MSHTSISFVLPMFNEAEAIEQSLAQLTEIAEKITDDYEIIVSNDGSTDQSGALVETLARKNVKIKTVHLEKNTKFGGALWKGIKNAKKEIIIYIDSDLPVEAEDIKSALKMLADCDIVTAFSTVKKGETLRRVIISKVYNFLIEALFRTNIKDINSGFKLYRRKVFEGVTLISRSPFIDVEIFIRAIRKKFTIRQYPIRFKHREKGRSYISRPAVIARTFFDMMRFRFTRG